MVWDSIYLGFSFYRSQKVSKGFGNADIYNTLMSGDHKYQGKEQVTAGITSGVGEEGNRGTADSRVVNLRIHQRPSHSVWVVILFWPFEGNVYIKWIVVVQLHLMHIKLLNKKSERPVDALAVKKYHLLTDCLTDNLKSRDASASKKRQWTRPLMLLLILSFIPA